MRKEIISITHCPHCNGAHSYQLAVQRALMLKGKKGMNQEAQMEITRLFVCPEKKAQFQATFYLKGKIKDVQVLGVEEETGNG